MLLFVVTPWKITSGIDGVATDVVSSFTSSRVREFTSNRASETLPAVLFERTIFQKTELAPVVNTSCLYVQSFVQDITAALLCISHQRAELYSLKVMFEELVTLLVFIKHHSLYFVDGFISMFATLLQTTQTFIAHLAVTDVKDNFRVDLQVLFTVVSKVASAQPDTICK